MNTKGMKEGGLTGWKCSRPNFVSNALVREVADQPQGGIGQTGPAGHEPGKVTQ